jgi:hypothetical protein
MSFTLHHKAIIGKREKSNFRDDVVDKQKQCSGMGRAVGGRERRSTAAVQTLRVISEPPGNRASAWTAVTLAPLCCLAWSWSVKDITPQISQAK